MGWTHCLGSGSWHLLGALSGPMFRYLSDYCYHRVSGEDAVVENRLQGYISWYWLSHRLSSNAPSSSNGRGRTTLTQRQGCPHPNGKLQSRGALQHHEMWNGRSELLYFLTRNPRGNRDARSRSMCAVSHTCLGWKRERKLQICCLAHRLWVCNIWDALALWCTHCTVQCVHAVTMYPGNV